MVVGSLRNNDMKIENDFTQLADYPSNTEQKKEPRNRTNPVRRFKSTRQVSLRVSGELPKKEPLSAYKTEKLTPRGSSTSSQYTQPEENEESDGESEIWKQFFKPEDIKSRLGQIINAVKTGKDDLDSEDAASDSQPSCDNY